MSDQKPDSSASTGTSLGFRNALLVVIAAFCLFAGPYVAYALNSHTFGAEWYVSMSVGFTLFAVGLALIGILIRKKIIS